ncbi:hypothetical protein K525DRAFT_275173 [Schizophyllum commune Loenen D]|nr:hypothetical protein K525DRAFT_275173 [Schizophyllum commune Loenen D]
MPSSRPSLRVPSTSLTPSPSQPSNPLSRRMLPSLHAPPAVAVSLLQVYRERDAYHTRVALEHDAPHTSHFQLDAPHTSHFQLDAPHTSQLFPPPFHPPPPSPPHTSSMPLPPPHTQPPSPPSPPLTTRD